MYFFHHHHNQKHSPYQLLPTKKVIDQYCLRSMTKFQMCEVGCNYTLNKQFMPLAHGKKLPIFPGMVGSPSWYPDRRVHSKSWITPCMNTDKPLLTQNFDDTYITELQDESINLSNAEEKNFSAHSLNLTTIFMHYY